MLKFLFVLWVLCAATSMAFLAMSAQRNQRPSGLVWHVLAAFLGPIFLFLILPLKLRSDAGTRL